MLLYILSDFGFIDPIILIKLLNDISSVHNVSYISKGVSISSSTLYNRVTVDENIIVRKFNWPVIAKCKWIIEQIVPAEQLKFLLTT